MSKVNRNKQKGKTGRIDRFRAVALLCCCALALLRSCALALLRCCAFTRFGLQRFQDSRSAPPTVLFTCYSGFQDIAHIAPVPGNRHAFGTYVACGLCFFPVACPSFPWSQGVLEKCPGGALAGPGVSGCRRCTGAHGESNMHATLCVCCADAVHASRT